MRELIKKSVAAALSTALLVTLGPVADISTVKAADDYAKLKKSRQAKNQE